MRAARPTAAARPRGARGYEAARRGVLHGAMLWPRLPWRQDRGLAPGPRSCEAGALSGYRPAGCTATPNRTVKRPVREVRSTVPSSAKVEASPPIFADVIFQPDG